MYETVRCREAQVRELIECEREFRKIAGEMGGSESTSDVLGQLVGMITLFQFNVHIFGNGYSCLLDDMEVFLRDVRKSLELAWIVDGMRQILRLTSMP